MDLFSAMENRQSARAYLDQPVSRADIEDILQHAAMAPSAINVQPWEYVIVYGEEKDRLVRRLQKVHSERRISCGPGTANPLPEKFKNRSRKASQAMRPGVSELGLEFNMICPDHGIIWRKDIPKIIDAYVRWSQQAAKNKALVIYDTMWHSTELLAQALTQGLTDAGVEAQLHHLRRTHPSDIVTEVLEAGLLLFGSPTLNNQMFPTVADVLTYMKGLKPVNKIGGAFGSYGWSGEAVKLVAAELSAMKFDMIEPGPRLQYVPDNDGLTACIEYGRQIGEAVDAALP